jgi:hypothetical protein
MERRNADLRDYASLVLAWLLAKEENAAAKRSLDALDRKVKALLRPSDRMISVAATPVATIGTSMSRSVDYDRLEREYPDAYKACVFVREVNRITVVKGSVDALRERAARTA